MFYRSIVLLLFLFFHRIKRARVEIETCFLFSVCKINTARSCFFVFFLSAFKSWKMKETKLTADCFFHQLTWMWADLCDQNFNYVRPCAKCVFLIIIIIYMSALWWNYMNVHVLCIKPIGIQNPHLRMINWWTCL